VIPVEDRACRRIIAGPACIWSTLSASRGRARGGAGPAGATGRGARPAYNPRGVRHALVVVLALTKGAVLAGATCLLTVGERTPDAPSAVLERLGIRPDPLFPKPCLPAETTVRRLLGHVDGDALDRAVSRWWQTDAFTGGRLRGLTVDGKSLRGAARADDPPAHRMRPRSRCGPGPALRG
jgi:hypothetical protein